MFPSPLPVYLAGADEKATAPVIEDDMMFADNGEMLLEYVASAQ